jgi:hypothetical protein
MLTFFKWYYQIQTRQIYDAFSGVFQQVAGLFDIPMMIKHITEPLYQDYSYQGRAIGFLIRSGRILLGLFIQLVLIIILGILMLLWVLLPAVIAVKIGYILVTM